MNPERWAQIEGLFHRAAECDPKQRASLLDGACNGDTELRRAVEVLLASEETARDDMRAAVRSGLEAATFPLVGETVSHYRILDGLGGGGMGLVYRAEDIKLGRQVALKFLPEDSAKDPGALVRFEREARSASALEHPNICPIYEFGEHEGQPFLVMQLLEGQTLRELISAAGLGKPPLEVNKLLDLAVQIAEGLEAAHHHGIVHRDIKPANIFVTTQGQAKILDFGLAKLSRGELAYEESELASNQEARMFGTLSLATRDPLLSRTGVAMGTAGYMSPEQARGEKLDTRTDLFSFGLVLYEMATGHRAFKRDTGPLLHDALLKNIPPPVRQLNPSLPAKLETILHKALEKDRALRYQSAAELRTDLASLKHELEPKHSLRRWIPAVAAGLALAIGGGIFWSAKFSRSPSQALPQIKLRQLTNNSVETPVTTGAISPDGKYLAYSDVKGIHIQQIENGDSLSVPQPESVKNGSVEWEIVSTAWFADSTTFLANAHLAGVNSSLWSSENTSIWAFSALPGVAPHKIRDNAMAWSVSPDGSLVSFGTSKGKLGEREIWLMDKDGDHPRKVFDTDEDSTIGFATWSPDGSRVIYAQTDKSGDTFVISDLAGGASSTFSPSTLFSSAETRNLVDVNWLPDGRLLYAVREPQAIGDTCNYWEMRLDSGTGLSMGKARKVTNWAGFCVDNTSVTKDSKHLAFKEWTGHATVLMADLVAGGTRIGNYKPFALDEGDTIVDWFADGKTVLIAEGHGDHYALFKRSIDSEVLDPIVPFTGGAVEAAGLTPDQKWVILQIWPNPGHASRPKIMRVPITGGSPQLVLEVGLDVGFNCAGRPSNLCVIIEPGPNHTMIVSAFDPIQGRGPELARFDSDMDPDKTLLYPFCSLSPDGTRLVTSRGPEGPIQILSLRGQPPQIVPLKDLTDLRLVGWTWDGNGLFVESGVKNGTVLRHVDLRGNAYVLWKCSGGQQCDYSPSPDGRYLAILDRKQSANFWLMENF